MAASMFFQPAFFSGTVVITSITRGVLACISFLLPGKMKLPGISCFYASGASRCSGVMRSHVMEPTWQPVAGQFFRSFSVSGGPIAVILFMGFVSHQSLLARGLQSASAADFVVLYIVAGAVTLWLDKAAASMFFPLAFVSGAVMLRGS